MKKILVSGGAGFIGSHLCTRLINDGLQVICLDNLFTGSEGNITHLKSNPRFEFVLHDVETPYEADVDEIYNLACPASPIHYQYDAIKTIKTSVLGAINMLGLAKKTNAKILQASTSEVYGDPVIHPQVESYWGNVNPIGLRSCYDEGKRCAETLFMDYHRQNGVRIKIIRIFNTYGPRMLPNDGRVVSNFVVQALQNQDITIYGSGNQTRSFQYVDDCIEGMVRMMDTEDEQEPLEIVVPGQYYYRNGSHYLRYEEMLDEQGDPTINYIKISSRGMEVRKKGQVNTHMVFEQGKRNMAFYTTPFGTLEMGISATNLELEESDGQIAMKVNYSLDLNQEHVADCCLDIQAQGKNTVGFVL